MKRRLLIGGLAFAAALLVPAKGMADMPTDFRFGGSAARFSEFPSRGSLIMRPTSRTVGDTFLVIGAVFLVSAIGRSESIEAGFFAVAGVGFVALGFDRVPAPNPPKSDLSIGYWRGRPTVSYTVLRF